jgi:3-hydroxyisobutyrate dehydrogenase-like beta-hydroxyacid dehydrogenase
MSDVSILGLGVMGSALARTLLGAGNRVSVWNRTSTKAEPLVREGATLAEDVASAIDASPVVLVCVDDYRVTRAILSTAAVRPHLTGRSIVQLSTGTPQEARDAERWVRDAGAAYLDCAILAYPDQIGTMEATLLAAGEEATFNRCEPLLRTLAGGLTYVGEQIGAASALDCASLSFLFGAFLGALHGASICEAEGLRVDEFGGMMADLAPVLGGEIRQLTGRIQADRYGESHSALRTYAAAAARLVQQARERRLDSRFPAYASEMLEDGVKAGLGDEDLAALIHVMRRASQTA